MIYEHILTDLINIAKEPHYIDVIIDNVSGETRRVVCADGVRRDIEITRQIIDELEQDTAVSFDSRRLEATGIEIYVLDKDNNVVEGAQIFCGYDVEEEL
jgi:hypothetical protein